MDMYEGEYMVANGWEAIIHPYYTNTPDINDADGPLITSPGYTWIGGEPTASPDGGTWQNVYTRESVTQTISGLIVGKTYYFRYYYCTQGITGYGFTYTTPYPPNVTITGASGYANPENAGSLFSWNSYCGAIVATESTITITASTIEDDYYLAYDGFYLSATPFEILQILQQPVDVIICSGEDAGFRIQSNSGNLKWQLNTGSAWSDITDNILYRGSNTDHLQINDAISEMNNYQYRCVVSGAGCIIYSSPATLAVKTMLTPSIVITSPSDKICRGDRITFTASTQHAGTSFSFQWMRNGQLTGSNGDKYNGYDLNGGDIISCTLKSYETCLTTSVATSNDITVILFPDAHVNLENDENLCNGTKRMLDAGNFKTYLWNDGSSGRILQVDKLGSYYVTVTDDNGCKASDTTVISRWLPRPESFLPKDTSVCLYESLLIKPSSGFKTYLWSNNSTESFLTITQPAQYWLEVTDDNNCKGRDTIIVSHSECQKGFFIPSAFTPNNDGKNDFFRPVLYGTVRNFKLVVYNRWGKIVFQSTDPKSGWDGTANSKKQDSGVFAWVCTYQLEGDEQMLQKGSVTLIR